MFISNGMPLGVCQFSLYFLVTYPPTIHRPWSFFFFFPSAPKLIFSPSTNGAIFHEISRKRTQNTSSVSRGLRIQFLMWNGVHTHTHIVQQNFQFYYDCHDNNDCWRGAIYIVTKTVCTPANVAVEIPMCTHILCSSVYIFYNECNSTKS